MNFVLEFLISPVVEVSASAYIDSVIERQRRLKLIKFISKFNSEIKYCYENGTIVEAEPGVVLVDRAKTIKFKPVSQLNTELKHIKIHQHNIATQAYKKQEYESQNIIELLGKLSQHIVVVQENYELFPFGKSLCVAICQRCS